MNTREFSNIQEERVSKLINGYVQPNSGATKWKKGDVINKDLGLLVECKTKSKNSNSFSIKKDWIENLKNDSLLHNINPNHTVLAISFDNEKDYYLINEKFFKELIDLLKEANE